MTSIYYKRLFCLENLTFSYMLLTTFIIGFLYASTLPTLAIYLSKHFVDIATGKIGLFFLLMALSQIVVSQWIGARSDVKFNRKYGILSGMISASITFFIFGIQSLNWTNVLLIIMFIYSISAITLPQAMALAREQIGKTKNTALANVALRSTIALAWVVGPPTGILLQNYIGVYSYYIGIGFTYFAFTILLIFILPNHVKLKSETFEKSNTHTKTIVMVVIAFSLLWGVNHNYMITMPLSLTERNIDTQLAGYLFSLTALLEIPVMIIGGLLAQRFSLSILIKFGSISAVIFYILFFIADSYIYMAASQLFNAIFIGLIAGIGLTWFQEMRADKPGLMSSIFMNCITAGTVVGSILVSLFPSSLPLTYIYAIDSTIALLATVLLMCIKKDKVV